MNCIDQFNSLINFDLNPTDFQSISTVLTSQNDHFLNGYRIKMENIRQPFNLRLGATLNQHSFLVRKH